MDSLLVTSIEHPDYTRFTSEEPPDYTDYRSNPCENGHIFTWTGGTEIPEGIPCQCGKTVYVRQTCPTCGHVHIVCQPIENPEPGGILKNYWTVKR